MTHGSLFSGIGGFDIAAEWMGWENKFHCEINPFCQKVLHHYWPNAEQFTDIKQTDFTKYANSIDVLTGGFPCQPYSLAGKRKGKEDERHLWPEMLRAIREIQPRWVVGENVFGLINWSGGLVFHEVQADLETEGYEVFPYILPAICINAPHERYRIWFIAYASSDRFNRKRKKIENENGQQKRPKFIWKLERRSERLGVFKNSTDTYSLIGLERGMHQTRPETTERHFGSFDTWPDWRAWENFPTVSPVCDGDDGIPRELDGITFSKWRQESIKGGGNAVVPQIPYKIFQAIEQYENLNL